jgi:diguanylate cyclase (GGDEF)-like protein
MVDITILVIDDDKSIHTAIKNRLQGMVDRILTAETPTAGIRMAIQEKPDVILLDINMPQLDGYKVCSHFQSNSVTRDIPVVFLTADNNVDHLAKALDCGGSDYILKPFNAIELEARVRAALRTKNMLDLLREKTKIDALTALNNRAAMDDALIAAVAAYHRTGEPLALLMIDLDGFKDINDTYGHGVGDAILRKIGESIQNCCRPYDTACRFGGDEFCVILAHVEGSDVQSVAQRILSGINSVQVAAGADSISVTTSAGFASSDTMPDAFDPSDLIKAADEALYKAKREGRHCLIVAEPA